MIFVTFTWHNLNAVNKWKLKQKNYPETKSKKLHSFQCFTNKFAKLVHVVDFGASVASNAKTAHIFIRFDIPQSELHYRDSVYSYRQRCETHQWMWTKSKKWTKRMWNYHRTFQVHHCPVICPCMRHRQIRLFSSLSYFIILICSPKSVIRSCD